MADNESQDGVPVPFGGQPPVPPADDAAATQKKRVDAKARVQQALSDVGAAVEAALTKLEAGEHQWDAEARSTLAMIHSFVHDHLTQLAAR